jgi:hypothetical protein
MNPHPVNAECTRAYKQVLAGERNKAVATFTAIGYTDAENQVGMIEGFIQFQIDWNTKAKRNRKGAICHQVGGNPSKLAFALRRLEKR